MGSRIFASRGVSRYNEGMTKKLIIIILIAIVVAALGLWFWLRGNNTAGPVNSPAVLTPADTAVAVTSPTATITITATPTPAATPSNPTGFVAPLGRAGERVTKKPFGIYITPANSPVQPERFTGYHTGTDFEIFPEELNIPVSVRAICDGTLKLKETASGYGGVAIQSCILNGAPVTVIYGHLKLASVAPNTGDHLSVGETVAVLGADKSTETDGERKHLHLGIHRGSDTNIKGYVAGQTELSGWADPCEQVCQ